MIANLSGQAAAVVAGAPKGRNRTVSFQSKKDSIFDKYRECVDASAFFLSLRSFFFAYLSLVSFNQWLSVTLALTISD